MRGHASSPTLTWCNESLYQNVRRSWDHVAISPGCGRGATTLGAGATQQDMRGRRGSGESVALKIPKLHARAHRRRRDITRSHRGAIVPHSRPWRTAVSFRCPCKWRHGRHELPAPHVPAACEASESEQKCCMNPCDRVNGRPLRRAHRSGQHHRTACTATASQAW